MKDRSLLSTIAILAVSIVVGMVLYHSLMDKTMVDPSGMAKMKVVRKDYEPARTTTIVISSGKGATIVPHTIAESYNLCFDFGESDPACGSVTYEIWGPSTIGDIKKVTYGWSRLNHEPMIFKVENP